MKAFQITAVLLYVVLAFGTARAAEPFDEAAWHRTVENQAVEKLYAPHFKDGKFFNPWLPMDEKKFWRFLQWRFSRKPPYTEEEKGFRADVIPGLADRIAALPAEDFIAWIGHATFLIITPEIKVYYGGDSGYFIGYREIGRRRRPQFKVRC